jgi:hypothetical protein
MYVLDLENWNLGVIARDGSEAAYRAAPYRALTITSNMAEEVRTAFYATLRRVPSSSLHTASTPLRSFACRRARQSSICRRSIQGILCRRIFAFRRKPRGT